MDDRAWIIGGQSIRHVDPKRRRGNDHFARHLVCAKIYYRLERRLARGRGGQAGRTRGQLDGGFTARARRALH